jgi:hypothetical protein
MRLILVLNEDQARALLDVLGDTRHARLERV